MSTQSTETPTETPRVTSRVWIWYFVLLVILGCVAMMAPVLYNSSIQLKLEQIQAARQQWATDGPRDYDLDYRIKRNSDRTPDIYHVEVRSGVAVRVICNGQLLLINDGPTGLALGSFAGLFRGDDPQRQTIDGIFDHLESLLLRSKGRAAPGRDYLVARFNPEVGHPIHFIFRVAGTHQRQEWSIQLTPRTVAN